jgi:predicted nucleotidyltransferase
MAPVWQEYKRHIPWAGIFGSVSRNRAKEESNVNVLIVLKQDRHLWLIREADLRESVL